MELKKIFALAVAALFALSLVTIYATSVYIHRNDNRFKVIPDEHGRAIDSRTGQRCLTLRSPEVSDVVSENLFDDIDKQNQARVSKPPVPPTPSVPFCGDIK
jgi:hypothetical protein